MCECYTIGGPWIAFDPECPEHGDEAQAREERRERTAIYQLQGRDLRWRDITFEEYKAEPPVDPTGRSGGLPVRKLYTE
jgi:hypothetical protein